MDHKKHKRKITYIIMMLIITFCLCSCTSVKKDEEEQKTEQISTEQTTALYLILENDSEAQMLKLYSYEDGNEYSYSYASSTLFKDKYEGITTNSSFVVGKIVSIGSENTLGNLLEVKMSADVWNYADVSRFSIDENKGVFTIGKTKYAITKQTKAFSNGIQIDLKDISKQDTLSIIGKEKEVLSIVVTKGQGVLELKNTTLFEESFLQLNTNIFSIITENMTMELEEGFYTLKVANNGWGGSCEIEIARGETTVVDLDELKGEGYKKGRISFQTDTENVTIKIDGKEIDISQPVELIYGIHSITVEAEGHAVWKKYLNVNSKEATIEIDLEEESTETETNSEMQATEENQDAESSETTQASESEEIEKESESKNSEEELEELLLELLQSNLLTGN